MIFMGDTNLNLLRFHSCKYAQNFILSLQSFNLMPTIDKPTRVHNNSYSLIDNIFIAPAGFWPRGQNPRRHYRNPCVIENMYGITRKNLESQEQGPQRIRG